MALVDRHGERGAIDLARRGVHHPQRAVLACRLEHIQRAEHIGFRVALRRRIGIRDGDERGEVKDDFLPLGEAAHEARIANIAAHQRQLAASFVGQIIEPSMVVEGIVQAKRRHLGVALHELLGQMRTDKAVGAGHENLEAFILHASFPGLHDFFVCQ
jgi:hypothetical protein